MAKAKFGVRISKETENKIFFWQNSTSRNKRIHISLNGESQALCNNATYDETICAQLSSINTTDKKLICHNCARIAGNLNPDDTYDINVQLAKKTVSRKTSNASQKNKRLQAHRKALSKTHEDFMAALENDPAKKNTIELPNEISEEQESLQKTLSTSIPILTALRKTAVMNLERVMHEWKNCNSFDTFAVIQEGQKIKQLIEAIDTIKSFKQKQH